MFARLLVDASAFYGGPYDPEDLHFMTVAWRAYNDEWAQTYCRGIGRLATQRSARRSTRH
jgi:hypothetical protein